MLDEKYQNYLIIEELEKEILILVGRLYDEDPSTFSTETYEVMKKWKPIFAKKYLKKRRIKKCQ